MIAKSLRSLMQRPPVVEEWNGYVVVREDQLPGGAKMRFLPFIVDPQAKELVYASPFCGGAAVCLSEVGKRTGQKVTLFYAQRTVLHPRQEQAKANGAKLIEISGMRFMNVVQARARAYAAERKQRQLVTIGFDDPKGIDPFVKFIESLKQKLGANPPSLWCACSSGMLTKCLGLAFPHSLVYGVVTGLRSHHAKQTFTPNVRLVESGYRELAKECQTVPPFPSCRNYDAKAWEKMQEHRPPPGSVFWNVL